MQKQESYVPLALSTLDAHLGSETQRAYGHALEAAPYLGGLAVTLTKDRSAFISSELGLAGSRIEMAASKDHYRQAIKEGVAARRLESFKDLLVNAGIAPRTGHLVTAVFLHELGHGADFQTYVNRANGDTELAFRLSRDVRKSQIAELPLKAANSHVIKAWENNSQGYQDSLRAYGITDNDWTALLETNLKEYADMPCERVADNFALGVMATMYSQ